MRISENKLRRLQRQRHYYDIQMMILSNPLFKNLGKSDQKSLQKIIYRAEMMEIFVRNKDLVQVNESFDQIVDQVMYLIGQDDEDEDERRRRDEDEEER